MAELQTATLAGGCFWCLDAIFRITKGVESVASGFSGGNTENPSYKDSHYNNTGEAETVQITFDPDVISYNTILEIFWATHNPTTLNRDGANVGTEYRSEIFYHDEQQRSAVEKSKAEVASKLWDDPIVTKISAYKNFYPAEDYHQDYYTKNPNAGYCQIIINPKLAKFTERFSQYLKTT